MAKLKMPCKVCGKEFEPCQDCLDRIEKGEFFWRGVVHSEECARIYFRRALKGLASNCTQDEEDKFDKLQKITEDTTSKDNKNTVTSKKVVTKKD